MRLRSRVSSSCARFEMPRRAVAAVKIVIADNFTTNFSVVIAIANLLAFWSLHPSAVQTFAH